MSICNSLLQGQDISFASVGAAGQLLRPGANTRAPLRIQGFKPTADQQWRVQTGTLINKASNLRLPLDVRLLKLYAVDDAKGFCLEAEFSSCQVASAHTAADSSEQTIHRLQQQLATAQQQRDAALQQCAFSYTSVCIRCMHWHVSLLSTVSHRASWRSQLAELGCCNTHSRADLQCKSRTVMLNLCYCHAEPRSVTLSRQM